MLVAQLDYIYFFYGLVLFLLGSVCVSMSRAGSLPTPWWLMGAFAFTHGIAEWLHILALNAGDSSPFRLARTVVLAASFTLLLEFARRTHRIVQGATLGPWLHVALAGASVGLSLAFGLAHLESAARLFLATPAISWTAGLFLFASTRTQSLGGGPSSRRARLWSGVY